MDKELRKDARTIIDYSIKEVLPDRAVRRALENRAFEGNVILIAIGKAAWNMASVAKDVLGNKISAGLIATKYGHSKGPIDKFEIIEAGHPIPDENSEKAAIRALELVAKAEKLDEIVFLISGGGSSIFEKPIEGASLNDIIGITDQLLSCGADIVEINTIRKRLSAVKAGRFAKACYPNTVFSIVLSDVVGNRLDSIASGPTYVDSSTSQDAMDIISKYELVLKKELMDKIVIETPKEISNSEIVITGSVDLLCEAASEKAKQLGYETQVLTTTLDCEAKEAGRFIAAIAREMSQKDKYLLPQARIFGGETVVNLIGHGKGGRNQELALSAAMGIEDIQDLIVVSVGSDGTDGPTDAAGAIVDGKSTERIREQLVLPVEILRNNDSYNALSLSGDLVIIGPTGTNVNDLMMILKK